MGLTGHSRFFADPSTLTDTRCCPSSLSPSTTITASSPPTQWALGAMNSGAAEVEISTSLPVVKSKKYTLVHGEYTV